MKNFILALVLFLLPFSGFSQKTEKSSKPDKTDESKYEPMYRLVTKFPVNVSNKYVYKESTKITRLLSNKTTLNFSRELTYHFSLRAPSAPDKQGFQLIEVSVDSMEYKFTNKDTTIYFNDQGDLRPPKLDDFQIKMVPLGLDFQITYSPYFDAAKVGGEMLTEKRDYLTDPKTAPSDEIIKATWMDGLKDEALLNLFDVVKGFPPSYKVDIDSVWNKEVLCEVEGSRFIDSVNFKLTNFNIKSFTITGTSTKMKTIPNLQRLFGLSQLIDFTDVSGTSEYKITLHPKGSVNQLEINQNLDMTYKVSEDFIQQKVESKKIWILEKMYNW